MKRLNSRGRLAAAAMIALSVASPLTASRAQEAPRFVSAPDVTPIELTVSDVEAANDKVRMAYTDLMGTWTASFGQIGERFKQPRLVRHHEPVRSGCGVMSPNNAAYCDRDNTVYYDDIFLAAQMKSAAQATGSDGDMAAVQIIAHEVGHAVAFQLGHRSRTSYDNEATADCLSGAFAQTSEMRGTLEQGDLDEAEHAISLAGDPRLQLTGNRRMDRQIQREAAMRSHGTADQRWQNFNLGLKGGAGACLAEFRS
jgi:uncharacterized protein